MYVKIGNPVEWIRDLNSCQQIGKQSMAVSDVWCPSGSWVNRTGTCTLYWRIHTSKSIHIRRRIIAYACCSSVLLSSYMYIRMFNREKKKEVRDTRANVAYILDFSLKTSTLKNLSNCTNFTWQFRFRTTAANELKVKIFMNNGVHIWQEKGKISSNKIWR